jgi:hypothetical protein
VAAVEVAAGGAVARLVTTPGLDQASVRCAPSNAFAVECASSAIPPAGYPPVLVKSGSACHHSARSASANPYLPWGVNSVPAPPDAAIELRVCRRGGNHLVGCGRWLKTVHTALTSGMVLTLRFAKLSTSIFCAVRMVPSHWPPLGAGEFFSQQISQSEFQVTLAPRYYGVFRLAHSTIVRFWTRYPTHVPRPHPTYLPPSLDGANWTTGWRLTSAPIDW